jgi:hypothetical protein
MNLFALLIVLVVGAFAEQEIFDRDTQDATSRLTKKLWTQIKKRLKDYGYSDSELNGLDTELNDESCIYDLLNGTIIRTHDSVDGGATFINSQIGNSREDCMEECCAISNCNVAVFKEKVLVHASNYIIVHILLLSLLHPQ